jgi:hypothetical protein
MEIRSLNPIGRMSRGFLLAYSHRYLKLTISPNSPIRKQDGARAFAAVAKNIVGSELAFDFLYTNIEEIAE